MRVLAPPLLLAALAAVLNSCGCSSGEPTTARIIPEDTNPCWSGKYWPLSVRSAKYPVLVHYRTPDELGTVWEVIAHIEAAWALEVVELGFPEPLSDHGECGPDRDFDVFIWRGKEKCYVQIIHDAPEDKYRISPDAPWGGRPGYMVVDPWGKYGGAILGQTIAHELNHASHAVDDWYEAGSVFEMTATYVEQYFNDAIDYNITDFQAHPDWAVLWYDDYRTYSMYGSALYLYFLRDYYFTRGGALERTFAARLWHAARNTTARPQVNKPNIVDALDGLLASFDDTYVASTVPFARWRYYAGKERDDGAHFKPWQDLRIQAELLPFLPSAKVLLTASIVVSGATQVAVDPPPMLTGSAYVEVVAAQPGQESFEVALVAPADPRVRWVVQAVPGVTAGSDGDFVDLGASAARVAFAAESGMSRRTLIVTAVPTGTLDPDDRTGERFPVALALKP